MLLAEASGSSTILLTLFLVLLGAKILAEVCVRLGQPAVVGEILAGVILGPSVLHWVAPSEMMHLLGEIGVMFLLFKVGLESKASALLAVGKRAALVAASGVVLPLLAGWALMRLLGYPSPTAWFTGVALVATSVGVTARVLAGMGLLQHPASRIILAAAVIDDILGILVLAAVSSFAAGALNYREIVTTCVLAVSFTVFVVLLGSKLLTRVTPYIRLLKFEHAPFLLGLVLCLGLALAATHIGVAAIIGAFLAGMALAEVTEHDHQFHTLTTGVTEFLVPFFLAGIGLQLEFGFLQQPALVLLLVLLTVVAVLTKLVGCGAVQLSEGMRSALQVGIGMVPRGEVGIVVAQVGLSIGVIAAPLFSVVVTMAVATTLIAPPLLRLAFKGEATTLPAATGH